MLLHEQVKPLTHEDYEAHLAFLTDADEYKKRRNAAEKRAGTFTIEEYKKLRILCKNNPFFLAYSVLGYTKLSSNLHGSVCNWITETQYDRFRLLLLPRGNYKSTIYTITDSIRAALPDDSNSIGWPYNLGTDIRICLMHEVAGVSSKFLSEIQNHFLSNELLMALFPECIPDPRKHTINMAQLQLPRKKFWKEKTFESMGVGGRSQGNHYNILKPDDLMGKEAKDSKIILESTNEWIDNLQSFLTSFEDPDHIDFTGTRWTHDDTYSHIMDYYKDQLKMYVRSMEEPKRDENGDIVYQTDKKGEVIRDEAGTPKPVLISIFPEQYPVERLTLLKNNKEIYSAQYMNDPESAESDLDVNKVRRYYWRNKESFTAFDNRANSDMIVYHRELYKILLVDPAMTGKLGMVVTGTDRRNRNFVLQCVKKAFKTPDLIKDIFTLVLYWQIEKVVFEKVLFSALYQPLFELEMEKRGIYFNIELQSVPQKKEKEKRIIDSLSPYLEEGSLYVNDAHKDLITEFKRLGYTQDIHMLDALAMGPHHWRPFFGNVNDPFNKTNYESPVDRDGTTGYTAM